MAPGEGGTVCLTCGRDFGVQQAHFPVDKGMGGRSKAEDALLPRVPLCLWCPDWLHRADPIVEERLEAKAPDWWIQCGCWDFARPLFEKWQARRAYLRALKEGHDD